MKRPTRFFSNWWLLLPMAIVVAIAGVAPFGEAVVSSFFHDIFGIRSPAGLDNYRYLLSDKGFSYSMNISFLWSALNTIMGLGISVLLAWKLSSLRRERRLLYAALLIPWGIPVYIAVPLWRSFFHGDGGLSLFSLLTGLEINLLTDPIASFLSALWVSIWMSVPFTAFILIGSFSKISKHLKEAALIDGADNRQILQKIYLPQISGTIAVLGILNFIKFMKEFNVIYLMTSGGPPLISGITDKFIIGATTTLDILIYEIFVTKEDLGISSAYAVMLAGVVCLMMLIWFLSKKSKVSRYSPALLVGISQLLFSSPIGLVWAVSYGVAAVFSKSMYRIVLSLQSIWIIYTISRYGFLEGFSSGILFALLIYIVLTQKQVIQRKKQCNYLSLKSKLHISRYVSILHESVTILLMALFLLSAALIIFLLIWLSISGLGSSYIDSLIPPFPTYENFIRIVVDEGILTYFLNTLLLSTATALLLPVIILPSAYYLLHKGRRTAFFVLTTLQIIGLYGGMHSLIPLYAFFRRLHLIDSYIPLILIYLNHSIPTALFTSLAYMEKIPASFEEQALLEGIRPLSYFRMILLPLSLPIIAVNIILAFIAAWNGFMAPLLFINTESRFPISVKLFSLVGHLASGFPQWNLFAAASIINCLIIVLLFYRFRNPMRKNNLRESQPY